MKVESSEQFLVNDFFFDDNQVSFEGDTASKFYSFPKTLDRPSAIRNSPLHSPGNNISFHLQSEDLEPEVEVLRLTPVAFILGNKRLILTDDGDLSLADNGNLGLGDPETNGSWRITREGDNLVFQRRESDTWVTKKTVTP